MNQKSINDFSAWNVALLVDTKCLVVLVLKSVILGDVYYKDAPQDSISGALQLGITTSVGSHSTDRDVLIQDFEIVESIYFPKCGTTQTSPHKFEDFRFKSYAPLAFRFFRDIFDISVQDFLNSIGAKPLVPMGNPGEYFDNMSHVTHLNPFLGASGSCFWVTHDDEFIVKTVSNKEAHFLQKLLPGYYLNLDQNPRTLLPKFYGLLKFFLCQFHKKFQVSTASVLADEISASVS